MSDYVHSASTSPTDLPVDVKNIFKKNNDGELKVPQVFLISTKGKVVWHQAFTSGRPFEKTNFVDQVKMYCKTGKLNMNGPAPQAEESSDEKRKLPTRPELLLWILFLLMWIGKQRMRSCVVCVSLFCIGR